MKKIKCISAILLITTVLVSASCSNDDEISDTTKPEISVTEPEEDQEVLIGDKNGMHIDMDLSDNVMLKSYKIEIHNNFDHHSHSSRAETVNFTFIKTYDISQNKNIHIHQHDVIIPDNATEGDYHLVIYCTDKAGNEAYVARDIKLSHNAQPDVD